MNGERCEGNHRFGEVGPYTARLRVTDSTDLTDTVRRTVNVTEPDGPVITNSTQPANGIIPQSDSPIIGVPNTWQVNATSDVPITEVTFEFPGRVSGDFNRTDTDGADGWGVSLSPGTLNFDLRDGKLDITVEDQSGNTTEQSVETEAVPRAGVSHTVGEKYVNFRPPV